MKIIIIGAGIAGLTLGIACQKAGMDVKIYEKTKRLQNIGGGILIWPHGLRYLEWLGLADSIKELYVPVKGCQIFGANNTRIFAEEYAALYAVLGGEILPIDRSLFQQTLLNQLAPDNVILNKKCISVINHAQHAQVIFEDGTEEFADLVVGADGIHSIVRQNLNAEATLQYTNYCWWGGVIDKKHVPALASNDVYVSMGLNKMCIAWPTQGERFMWYLPVKMPFADFHAKGNGLTQLQSLCAGWDDTIEQIISAPGTSQQFHLAIHALPPQPRCSNQHTVLIGDAAHALGPILGQGASQAIEDAFLLAGCLQNMKSDMASTLHYYESLRHDRYQRIAQLENQTAELMMHDNVESLIAFEQELKDVNLVMFYQDLIPLVDEQACIKLAASI